MSGKRSIFEDVSETQESRQAPQTGLIDQGRGGARRGIQIWLGALFAITA